MKKHLLTCSMLFAALGIQAQTAGASKYYLEGRITEADQLNDGDFVVLQDVNSSDRQGYIYKGESQFQFDYQGVNARTLSYLKSTADSKSVFQIVKKNGNVAFKLVGTKTFLKNDIAKHGGPLETVEGEGNLKNIDFVVEVQDNGTCHIKSADVQKYYLNGNPGSPTLWEGVHPYYIYKVSEKQVENQAHPWYYISALKVSGDRAGRCMQVGNDGNDATHIWTAPSMKAHTDKQIWKITENATKDGFALVSKSNEEGAVSGSAENPNSVNAKYTYNQKSSESNYNFLIEGNCPEFAGASTVLFRRKDATSTTNGTWCVNISAGGKGFYVNEYDAINDGGNSNFWSLVVAAELKKATASSALGSFSAPYAVTIPEGVEAYVATEEKGNSITLTKLEGTVLPAHTAVILKADQAGFYPMVQTTSTEGVVTVGKNLLKGSEDAHVFKSGSGCYILGKVAGMDSPAMCNYTATTIPAFKAYLPKSSSAAPQFRSIEFNDGETTGIEGTEVEKEDSQAPIYNLQGQRVMKPLQKGIYIQNGKKFVVK